VLEKFLKRLEFSVKKSLPFVVLIVSRGVICR